MEFKFPFFNDIWRMHWLAQPFAALGNIILGIFSFVVVVLVYVVYVAIAAVMLAAALPVVLATEAWDWIRRI